MSPLETYGGGCVCGAVRFEARSPALNVRLCHCRNCQKLSGSAFFARAMFPADAVTHSGPVKIYASSADLDRLSCDICGSILGARRASTATTSVTLGALDDPDVLPPTAHIFYSRKVAWLILDDDLPRYDEWAPA